jgi:hypothetical protein
MKARCLCLWRADISERSRSAGFFPFRQAFTSPEVSQRRMGLTTPLVLVQMGSEAG